MSSTPAGVAPLTLSGDATVAEALASLQRTGKGIALLNDQAGRLQRVFTDGDLRRFILAGSRMDAPLGAIEHGAPRTAPVATTHAEALAMMDRWIVDQLPLIDDEGRPREVLFRRDLANRIFLSSPHLGKAELDYVSEAFASNWIAPLGPNVDAFENELARVVEVKHAAALSSGTAGLHLALRILDCRPGDTVLCSSLTFVASANPILYEHAIPEFVDSDPESWNMSPTALERALEQCRRENRLPRAIIVVDLYGQSADYDALQPLCEHYGVPIIEDAAEALGATYKGRPCGGFGRMGVFSFNGNKIITTSGGGMLVSDREEDVIRARKLSTQAREPAAHYEHKEIGFNYRMSNVLAGIGRGQLGVLAERVEARRRVFARYVEQLGDLEAIRFMPETPGSLSNRWLTTLTLDPSVEPRRLLDSLGRLDIEARPVWKPMHLQPLFRGAAFHRHGGNRDVAAELFDQGLCLPSGSNMSDAQIDRVCDAMRAALTNRQPS